MTLNLPTSCLIFAPLLNPRPTHNAAQNRPPTEVRFARWNNANAKIFNQRRKAQQEIEDDIRRERRFDRDGLERVTVENPQSTTVSELKSLIQTQLRIPFQNQTISTSQNLLLAKTQEEIARFTDMANPNTSLTALNLAHGSIVYLAYDGERSVAGPAFHPAGSFGRKMTMDDLIAKQMKVTRQENPHCELVSFDRDCANAFQHYVNDTLAFATKRG
ncbi:hypothetical protein ACFX2I_045206 [Malus domestica]